MPGAESSVNRMH